MGDSRDPRAEVGRGQLVVLPGRDKQVDGWRQEGGQESGRVWGVTGTD